MREENLEQPFAPIYNYALVTDTVEGLILVDINTLADGDFRNNFLRRALTWNPGGALNGARHVTIGGNYRLRHGGQRAHRRGSAPTPLLRVSLASLPLRDARASVLQFRYLFVTDAEGLEVVDVTHPEKAKAAAGREPAVSPRRAGSSCRALMRTSPTDRRASRSWTSRRPEHPGLLRQFDAGGAVRPMRATSSSRPPMHRSSPTSRTAAAASRCSS